LSLWLAIKEIHLVTTTSKVEAIIKKTARTAYQKCAQGEFETIVEYKRKFDSALEGYKASTNTDMGEKDIAMDFLFGLDDNRYADFKADIINDMAKGIMSQPMDLNAMYLLASRRVVVQKKQPTVTGATFVTGLADKIRDPKKNNNNQEKTKSEKQQRNKKNVKCYNCGEKGHFARDCTEDRKEAGSPIVGATMNACYATVNRPIKRMFEPYEVCLDSGSQVNIIHPMLLRKIRTEPRQFKSMNGIGGTTEVGILDGFFDCQACEDCPANILCQADVEDIYPMTFEPGECIIVHMDDRDVEFVRRNKMYVADFSDWIQPSAVNMTVTERESLYNKSAIKKAKAADEFVRNAGYPTANEAAHLVRDGNIVGIPHSADDIAAYFDIYGAPVASMRGKTTNQKARALKVLLDSGIKEQQTLQTLEMDIMHADTKKFLITVSSPLELTIVSHVEKMDRNTLGRAVQSHIDLLKTRGFQVTKILIDPQRALTTIKTSFPGVTIEECGAGDHLSRVDAKIRRVKEMARSILAGLPYKVGNDRIKDLITYVVSRINTRRTTGLSTNVSPRVRFTGQRIDYVKEYALGFGDYVEVYDPKSHAKSNNIRMERTEPCIALYPSGNLNGSWIFWNLKTKAYVRRSQWKKIPISSDMIQVLNGMAGGKEFVMNVDELQVEEDPQPEPSVPMHVPPNEPSVVPMTTSEENLVAIEEETMENRGELPSEDQFVMTHLSMKKAIKEYGQVAIDACKDEMFQMFLDKKVLVPVKWNSLSKNQRSKIVKSFMFLTEKFDAMGMFERMKARLVGDGRMQDQNVYQNRSSPTAQVHSIMIALKVAAVEKMDMMKIDVKGAYLNADIDDTEEVFVELDRELTVLMLEWLPELIEFVREDGHLIVQVEKALYGLVQSALLWYEHLSSKLESRGFVKNPVDPCVMHMTRNECKVIVVIYVDYLLVLSADGANHDWFESIMKEEFKELSVDRDKNKMSYLGMVLDRQDGCFKISMTNYIKGILELHGNPEKRYATPAKMDFFEDSNDVELAANKEHFHTIVAKLLYLAKRARPDILLAVQYLCTKVKSPTTQDEKRLERIMGYLAGTLHRERVIDATPIDGVRAYVDAAFACHSDAKSQTGAIICIGKTSVMEIAKKQKIVTKDSTEAELVALSDMIPECDMVYDFLTNIGYDLPAPTVYQDNTSTISLVTTSKARMRTKHLRARQSSIREQWEEDELVIEYINTKEMLADILTKPLSGKEFHHLARVILGESDAAQQIHESQVDRGALSVPHAGLGLQEPNLHAVPRLQGMHKLIRQNFSPGISWCDPVVSPHN